MNGSCHARKKVFITHSFYLASYWSFDQKVQVWQELLITILLGRTTRKLGRYSIPICDMHFATFRSRPSMPSSCLFSREIRLHFRILSDTICHWTNASRKSSERKRNPAKAAFGLSIRNIWRSLLLKMKMLTRMIYPRTYQMHASSPKWSRPSLFLRPCPFRPPLHTLP